MTPIEARGDSAGPSRLFSRGQEAEAQAEEDPLAALDKSLAAAEARLLAYLATDSEDDKDFIPTFTAPRATHDDKAGLSGADTIHKTSPLVPPPVVTAVEVTIPDTLAQILQTLTQHKSRCRLK